jgi:hypothetical protein
VSRLRDRFALLVAAFLVVVVGGGMFVTADVYHVNSLWVFLVMLSVGFFGAVGWDYRKEFRRPLFVLFFCVWSLLNFAVFIFIRNYFTLLCYPVALFVEFCLFYATAYWLFGLRPPLARKGSESDENPDKKGIA